MRRKMALSLHSFQFDGELLRRGFWLYVWRIRCNGKSFVYVGRTGDSSSVNAASPFSRVSRHLELREGARSNALVRNLRDAGVEPSNCRYEFFAVGPIYPEADDRTRHEQMRDEIAAVEAALAQELSGSYKVLGTHGSRKQLDDHLFRSVLTALPEELLRPEIDDGRE
jgi:hypothetical protein